MKAILDFLNEPIVLTLLSLTLGGFLLSLLSDRRARKDKIRDKAIELLTEVGNDINSATGRIFGYLRAGNVHITRDPALSKAMGNLFTKRMSVRIRGKAYLDSEEFYQKYNTLVWQLRHVIDYMTAMEGEHDLEQMVTDIQNGRRRLSDDWPLEGEQIRLEEFEPPFNELLAWTSMIFQRATDLLSTYLKSSLK